MQAVVLVGGLGTRLRPLTLSTPKPLVPVANRPLLVHILMWLADAGVTEVLLATQYAAAAFGPLLARWDGVPVRAIEEATPLGTAGAVRNVRSFLHGTTLVVNGDNLSDLDLRVLINRHGASGAQATIAVAEVGDPTGKGVVVADGDGRVRRFQEKPAPGTALARTVNAGVYVIEPTVLDRLAPNTVAMWETDLFPDLIAADVPVYAAELPQRWVDAGTPEGYFDAQAMVLGGRVGTPAGREVRPGLWLEDNVSLSSAARVVGPAAFGFGAIVAAGVEVQGPVAVGRDVHLLPETVLTRSAVWDGTLLERGVVLNDTIVGYNCYIGVGVHLNGALVGDGCTVGSGTTLADGARLAPGTRY